MAYMMITILGLLTGLMTVTLIAKSGTYLSLPACLLPNRYVSWRYFFLPTVSGGLSWVLWFRTPSSTVSQLEYFSIVEALRFFAGLLFLAGLTGIAIEGFTRDNVPDLLTKPGMVAGCLFALFVPGFSGTLGVPHVTAAIDSLMYNGLGCVLGMGGLWAVARIGSAVFKMHDHMGRGNLKLAGMLGAFLGPSKLLVVVVLSALLGLVVGIIVAGMKAVWTTLGEELKRRINYSGLLALTAFPVFFFGDTLIKVYLRILKGQTSSVPDPAAAMQVPASDSPLATLIIVSVIVLVLWIGICVFVWRMMSRMLLRRFRQR